jgi:hypothetical protein
VEVGDQWLGLDPTAKDPEEELSNDPFCITMLSLFYSLISILMVLPNSTIVRSIKVNASYGEPKLMLVS